MNTDDEIDLLVERSQRSYALRAKLNAITGCWWSNARLTVYVETDGSEHILDRKLGISFLLDNELHHAIMSCTTLDIDLYAALTNVGLDGKAAFTASLEYD